MTCCSSDASTKTHTCSPVRPSPDPVCPPGSGFPLDFSGDFARTGWRRDRTLSRVRSSNHSHNATSCRTGHNQCSVRAVQDLENPFEVVGVIGGRVSTYAFFGVSGILGVALVILGSLAALFSLILRLHHTRGSERQQLKWFLFAAVPLSVFLSLIGVDAIVASFTTNFMYHPVYMLYSLRLLLPVHYVSVLALLAVPVFTYIAILKCRLYDIDVAINRTLVYGSLTALLATVYFGGVGTTEAIFRALTGQERQPQLAVVVSTIVIAALFTPLKKSIQSFIDRRFYRRKYDSAKTLETFSAKLRDETDLARIIHEGG
jgi:hypothetical protein